MNITFLPQTKLGKWAVGVTAMWPLLTITMLLGIALGAVSFPMSLTAIFKKGERSVFSILAALLGLFLVILLAGEFFVEH